MHVSPTQLLAVADRLTPRDAAIARDMATRAAQYGGFSTRQQAYAASLYRRATGQQIEGKPEGVSLGDPSKVYALLQAATANAGGRVLPAKLRLTASDLGGRRHRLKLALVRQGREAGNLKVELADELEPKPWGTEGPRVLGFVSPDGGWRTGYRMQDHPVLANARKVLDNLFRDPLAFAARCAAAAVERKEVGRCCFCGRALHDNEGRSLAVGYGPDCAARWGLPWGEARVATTSTTPLAAEALPEAPSAPEEAPEPLHPVMEAHAQRFAEAAARGPRTLRQIVDLDDDLTDLINHPLN